MVGAILLIFQKSPKVEVKDSNLNSSPIVVDSPNAQIIFVTQRKPNRHLNDDLIAKLNQILPDDKNKKIIFGIPPESNIELWNFVNEIKLFLEKSNYNVGEISKIGNFPIFEGDIKYKDWGDLFEFYIGMNN